MFFGKAKETAQSLLRHTCRKPVKETDKYMTDIRQSHYRSPNERSWPRKILDMYLRKCALRSELAAVTSELNNGVEALNPSELEELKSMMAREIETADADAQALRAQVEAERALAETVRPLTVNVSRKAAALSQEARRRLGRGVYRSSASLTNEAIYAAYGAQT